MSSTDNKRQYYNSIAALVFVENGHALTLTYFPKHYIMVFDLTSTQENTHDSIHPELTSSSLSVELIFGAAPPNNIEILFLGGKCSTVYIDSARKVSINALSMS